MMTQAYYTGISGLRTTSSGVDLLAENLANVNTVGFRGSSYEFASLFEEAVTTANTSSLDSSVGIGSRLQATTMMESAGNTILTDKSTDLAISGNGWFGVTSQNETFYTRNGAFSFDENNDLVTDEGAYVLGTVGGNISDNKLTKKLIEVPLSEVASQTKLNFPKDLAYPVEPTTKARFEGNLSTEDEVRTMSASVIDAQSNRNNLRLEFTKSNPQPQTGVKWDVKATVKSLDGEIVYDTKTGFLEFDEAGALKNSVLGAVDNNGSPVSIDLGKNFSGVVAISNVPITSSSTSDGIVEGELKGYDINQDGEIVATFTNGVQSSVGQIAVYHFQNDQGLDRVSGTKFKQSENSGDAMFFKDKDGKNVVGTDIFNYRLEGSNVDMTYSLTEMIVLQRAYESNSKVVTTADEMIQKALDMDA